MSEEKQIYANEIQIRDFKNGQMPLVLICPDESAAVGLSGMIKSTGGNFSVKCYLNKDSELTVGLLLAMPELAVELKVPTTKTEANYPPVAWLLNGQVNFISTGWLDDKRQLTYTDLIPLDNVDLPD
ncbi:hypothetical protein VRU48_03970 [Pedobacter sp. KR3-3]|uniref:Uncharacterized protein n=1 Tax=Pedobacter albus TaxID=3113905 RepID=A0ABU7I455_9SPHI|nr:hypothetical protein [Pedobacter sp. KR3-3]MEE1944251.1 hypothetical protein [Pedobacter sp. KR3-3]